MVWELPVIGAWYGSYLLLLSGIGELPVVVEWYGSYLLLVSGMGVTCCC